MYRILNIVAVILFVMAGSIPTLAQDKSVSNFWGTNITPNEKYASSITYDLPDAPADSLERLRYWNLIALAANGLDHTPVAPGETRIFGEQFGPARSARAMAMVHMALFEAVNVCKGNYPSAVGMNVPKKPADVDAAIAKSVAAMLMHLYPSQAPTFSQLLAEDLARIPDGAKKNQGITAGAAAAFRTALSRFNDGSDQLDPLVGQGFISSIQPGMWRQDPISLVPIALGATWGEVRPFVMTSGSQFRATPPPALTSAQYTAAYDEVKRVGGDGIITPTERTPEQTLIALYWAYDGTPGLGTPPRLYNQITNQITLQKKSSLVETARLFALVNIAMADASIAGWESKYYYQFWRPITAVREADPGTGPTGLGDGNPNTIGDVNFTPLGAPASGLVGPNFTPPFPSYPSGHATFGGAVFETLRRFYGTDNIRFTFVSDELNGITIDNLGHIRPLAPRTFNNLTQAEEENGQSRMYLGIHYAFDKTAGDTQGRAVADYVYDHLYTRNGNN